MGTLTSLMNIGTSALLAEEAAINTTSKNVANQTTTGYTREVASFQDVDAVTIGSVSTTSGVTESSTSQRDLVLEQNLHIATSSASSASARLSALQQMETAFGLSSSTDDSSASSTAIGSALDSFSSSLTALSADPTDTATQNAVITAAQTLASSFNSAATTLQGQVSDLNQQIATSASQVNSLTSTVASLNQQILTLGSSGDAGELEDQRQQAIEQLSAIVGVNQITQDGDQINLTLSNGAALVSGSQSFSFGTTSVGGKTEITAGSPSSVQSGVTGGSIGGMLEARDTDIPTVQSSLDELAYGVGMAVDEANESGVTSSGSTGVQIFDFGSWETNAAATISVNATSGSDLALASSDESSTGTGNIANLVAATTDANVGGQTASDYFSGIIGQVGDTVSSADTASTAATAAQTQAQTTRDSLSGVSLDDEASSLMTYQRAYQAASKVITIVDEMMESAINLGTATSV